MGGNESQPNNLGLAKGEGLRIVSLRDKSPLDGKA